MLSRIMRGKRGAFLLLLGANVYLASGGCSKQPPRIIQYQDFAIQYHITAEAGESKEDTFLRQNDAFSMNCQKHLKLVEHVRKTHVMGSQVDLYDRLRTAMIQVLQEGKLPTPLVVANHDKTELEVFYQGERLHYAPPVLLRYVSFISNFDSVPYFYTGEDFCKEASHFSSVIQQKLITSLSDVPNTVNLESLFHKSIFRYFVTGLDPHSGVQENAEHWYKKNGLQRYLENGRHDNIYYEEALFQVGEDRIQPQWVENSDILKIEILDFSNEDFGAEFKAIYEKATQEKKPKALILDLRRNGGGFADASAQLADLFISKGLLLNFMVKVGDRFEPSPTVALPGNEIPGIGQIPVIVLVGRFSASSSETFAAAMKDNGAAIVIGEDTFGKGTGQFQTQVNQMTELTEKGLNEISSVLTLTTFYTFSPNGDALQLKGVAPHIELQDQAFLSYGNFREKSWHHALSTASFTDLPKNFQDEMNPLTAIWKMKLDQYFSDREKFRLRDLYEALNP